MSDEPEFPNRFREQTRVLLGATLLSIALFVVGGTHTLRGDLGMIALVVGLVGGTFGLIFTFAWWITGRSLERQLDAFRQGQHLARWTLKPEEWNPFAREMNKQGRVGAALCGVILGAAGVLTGLLIAEDGDPIGGEIVKWSLVGGVVLWIVLRRAMSTWAIRRRPVLVVYGPQAGVFDGKVISWNTFGYQLKDVGLDEETRRLLVHVLANTGHGDTQVTHRLPFPHDRLDEARALVEALAPYKRA